jgi:hypothetical protein
MDHDFYWLFSHFWWLLFPLFWAIGRMIRVYLDHQRAGQALEVVRTYANQGKEIPPELLKVLQQPTDTALRLGAARSPRDKARMLMLVGFTSIALAAAFCVLIIGQIAGDDREAYVGMMFVVMLFLGVGAAFLATGYFYHRDAQQLDSP